MALVGRHGEAPAPLRQERVEAHGAGGPVHPDEHPSPVHDEHVARPRGHRALRLAFEVDVREERSRGRVPQIDVVVGAHGRDTPVAQRKLEPRLSGVLEAIVAPRARRLQARPRRIRRREDQGLLDVRLSALRRRFEHPRRRVRDDDGRPAHNGGDDDARDLEDRRARRSAGNGGGQGERTQGRPEPGKRAHG